MIVRAIADGTAIIWLDEVSNRASDLSVDDHEQVGLPNLRKYHRGALEHIIDCSGCALLLNLVLD